MSEDKAFKHWFGRDGAEKLAEEVARSWPGLDRQRFVAIATEGIDALELVDRIKQFSRALEQTLPADVSQSLEILTRSLPEPMPGCEEVTNGFLQWPIGQYIADHGLEHFELSMTAMTELTKRFSSEFAVRPFVEHRPKETFERLLVLCRDPNPHVRRWCSEGTRPRLPWGKKLRSLVQDPSPIIPILEALRDDPEPYVRRSVANNLNDIAKDHPAVVLELCRRWSEGATEQRRRLIAHALRTLIKDGNPEALALVGYGKPRNLEARLKVAPRRIRLGESVRLTAELSSTSPKPQGLLVDYVVHYVRGEGKTGAKVFKWKTVVLEGKKKLVLEKRHAMKQTTIRALYSGRHRVELQVNGHRVAEAVFVFQVEEP